MLDILVVEDEKPIRDWIVYTISNISKDFNVLSSATNGKEAYSKAENRMVREFTIKYCKDDGSIDWDTLIKFNSGD